MISRDIVFLQLFPQFVSFIILSNIRHASLSVREYFSKKLLKLNYKHKKNAVRKNARLVYRRIPLVYGKEN